MNQARRRMISFVGASVRIRRLQGLAVSYRETKERLRQHSKRSHIEILLLGKGAMLVTVSTLMKKGLFQMMMSMRSAKMSRVSLLG